MKTRLLKDLPGVEDTEDTREPLIFFDTQGGDFPEKTEDEGAAKKVSMLGESKANENEAALVKLHVNNLVNAGIKPEDIAVITPYNAQLAILSQLLREKYPGIELGSVDGFQGREKEVVIVSLVRSGGDIGFLAEKRRLNGTFEAAEARWLMVHEEFILPLKTPVPAAFLQLILLCAPVSMTRPSRQLTVIADSETLCM